MEKTEKKCNQKYYLLINKFCGMHPNDDTGQIFIDMYCMLDWKENICDIIEKFWGPQPEDSRMKLIFEERILYLLKENLSSFWNECKYGHKSEETYKLKVISYLKMVRHKIIQNSSPFCDSRKRILGFIRSRLK